MANKGRAEAGKALDLGSSEGGRGRSSFASGDGRAEAEADRETGKLEDTTV